MHLRQGLLIGALAGVALVADLAFAAAPVAAAGETPADPTINNDTVSTYVSVSEDGHHRATVDPSYLAPTCWLSPFGGDGATPVATYTPDEFTTYANNIIAVGTAPGATPPQASYAYEVQSVYQTGNPATNSVVGLSAPPYNTGLTDGAWDWIVCSINADYVTILDLEGDLGVNNNAESWFWVGNGTARPTIDGNILAEYAAASMTVSDQWPTTSPNFADPATPQTVNLPTQVTNAPGANGYFQYSATAALTLEPNISSTVTATPQNIVISSPSIEGGSVTCDFTTDANGRSSLDPGCSVTFDQAPKDNQAQVTGTVTWNVTWGGGGGEPGWTKPLVVHLQQGVTVREIQTIINGSTAAPPNQ